MSGLRRPGERTPNRFGVRAREHRTARRPGERTPNRFGVRARDTGGNFRQDGNGGHAQNARPPCARSAADEPARGGGGRAQRARSCCSADPVSPRCKPTSLSPRLLVTEGGKRYRTTCRPLDAPLPRPSCATCTSVVRWMRPRDARRRGATPTRRVYRSRPHDAGRWWQGDVRRFHAWQLHPRRELPLLARRR